MTSKELNRDIKKLNAAIKSFPENKDLTPYFNFIEEYAKQEFKRLYYADDKFTAINRSNVLIMFRLNLKHRFIPFHQFGINIEL